MVENLIERSSIGIIMNKYIVKTFGTYVYLFNMFHLDNKTGGQRIVVLYKDGWKNICLYFVDVTEVSKIPL